MKDKSLLSVSCLTIIGMSVGFANAATVLTENFETGATGWNLNASPGTSSTTIGSQDLGLGGGSSNVLQIATGSPYQIAETPVLDLTGATTATITFDYGDENGGATRFISVDFFDGTSWVQLGGNITHSTDNAAGILRTVSAGFGPNNRFRFEGKNSGGGGTRSTFIDNVVVEADVAPIPEPSSLVLLGLGAFGLAARRRR